MCIGDLSLAKDAEKNQIAYKWARGRGKKVFLFPFRIGSRAQEPGFNNNGSVLKYTVGRVTAAESSGPGIYLWKTKKDAKEHKVTRAGVLLRVRIPKNSPVRMSSGVAFTAYVVEVLNVSWRRS